MGRPVRRQAAVGLLELALAADPVAATGLVPGDRHVDEALEEVAFLRRRRPPHVLQLLVGGEVFAGPDQREAALERRLSVHGATVTTRFRPFLAGTHSVTLVTCRRSCWRESTSSFAASSRAFCP